MEHQVAGAIGIAQYFLPQPPSGVTIDQNTGTVTIDGPSLRQAMMQYLVASFKAAESSGKANASPPAKLLQAKLAELNPTIIKCAQHLQRRMDGYPMLVPIYIRATDAEGHVAELQYYLLDTISLQQISKSAIHHESATYENASHRRLLVRPVLDGSPQSTDCVRR